MPRNRAANPTQIRISVARAGKNCCDAQNPSKSSRIPVTRPSHQSSLTSLVIAETMMSRLPFSTRRKPRSDASAQNALYGLKNAVKPPITNRMASAK
jgi:hypothetical protein